MTKWKVRDWAVKDLDIVQIKEIKENGNISVSDGMFETSGKLLDRLRPLTLRNKRIIENFEYYYKLFDKIDGEAGFNYPDIRRHFSNLSLKAIDGSDDDYKEAISLANSFVKDAQSYIKEIQGIRLFRRIL